MSEGKWSGDTANRTWVRPGSRLRNLPGDAARSARLYAALADARFWCDACTGCHPLREHADCLAQTASAIAAQARADLTRKDAHDQP